ncbi:hypothetical protein AVEN_43245-1, partial [Araneus ventricosus]
MADLCGCDIARIHSILELRQKEKTVEKRYIITIPMGLVLNFDAFPQGRNSEGFKIVTSDLACNNSCEIYS